MHLSAVWGKETSEAEEVYTVDAKLRAGVRKRVALMDGRSVKSGGPPLGDGIIS